MSSRMPTPRARPSAHRALVLAAAILAGCGSDLGDGTTGDADAIRLALDVVGVAGDKL